MTIVLRYKVTINGDTSLWNKQDTNYYVNTLKSIETEIYELKCTNNQKYRYSFLIPNTIIFRRYSVKGEKPFSEADAQE